MTMPGFVAVAWVGAGWEKVLDMIVFDRKNLPPDSQKEARPLFTEDQLKQAFEAGRASMMAEFEQV